MGQGGIAGSTTVRLYDHFRARLAALNLYLVGGILVLAVGYGAFQGQHEFTPLPVSLMNAGILLIAVAVGTVIIAVVVNLMMAAITAARLSKNQKVIAYQFDDRGFTMGDLNGSAITTPWNTVRNVREDSRSFCFRLRPAGARYVPKRAFAAADVAAVRTLLVEKLGKTAKLKV